MPECHVIIDDSIKIIGNVDAKNNWSERKEIVLNSKNAKIFKNMDELIELGKKNRRTRAIFKPVKISRLVYKEEENREWDKAKLRNLLNKKSQLGLFADNKNIEKQFEVVKKVPYRFWYEFTDENGQKSKMRIFDWEIGALFWNCFDRYKKKIKKEKEIIEKKPWTMLLRSMKWIFWKIKIYIFFWVLRINTRIYLRIHLQL
ncbi:MAG: hypothetical protein PF689_07625 [Deltaproteobacteria bacterium]|jgi:hypothetical protein|nr:hypothetical protein [Deltaproteobacteria bacterium]